MSAAGKPKPAQVTLHVLESVLDCSHAATVTWTAFGTFIKPAACCMQGGDCFGAFMQWGLPKGTLKDVWAAVAGDQGYLSQQQFVQCLYLMDNAKRVSLPPLLL